MTAPRVDQPQAGVFHGVDMVTYRALDAVGASDLWTLANECPAIAHWRKTAPDDDTAAMAFGRAFHCLILEPDQFPSRYAVRPDLHPNSKDFKAWEAGSIASGRETLKVGDMALMDAMRASLPVEARRLLKNGHAEATAICRNEHADLWLKTRPDWLRRDAIAINLKTAADPNPRAWAAQAARLGYHASAALMLDVLREITGETHEHYWIVVGKEPPHEAYIAQMSDMDIEAGRQAYHRALMKWAECVKASHWPGYGPVAQIQLPAWATKQEG